MKARMPAGFGRPDMNSLMRQAQKMQEDMKAKQAELEAAEYTGSASGEMVTVKMNGKHAVNTRNSWIKNHCFLPPYRKFLPQILSNSTMVQR